MFEDLFHQIDIELGPLNPDWFEELTAKASRDEGHPESSKAEEETVKATEKSALATQLFSTPKIFKAQHFESPNSIPNEGSPYEVTNGDSSAFPWTETSPSLFGSAKDRQKYERSCEKPRDSFGLLDTPKGSLAHSAKRISESLGAQINPDLSWTSSFNTPPSLTPTVILTKTEDRFPPSSGLKNREAIFVRKLFPSLSKDSASTATVKQDEIANCEAIQADDLGEKPVGFPNASPDTSGLWKQKVPSAIEDGDVRSTVQNVLDGAEDVLSIFFSNSTSILRVKAKERIRRRIADSTQDVKSVVLISEPEEKLKAEVGKTSLNTNEDVSQWTPLSLSKSILNEDCSVASSETTGGTVPNCTAETSQTQQGESQMSQCQISMQDKSPAFMLTRKSRKFVYQVPKESCDLNQSRFTSENAINKPTLPQTVEQLSLEPCDINQGLDMTQLSKAFAEDFTQEIMAGGPLDMPVQSDKKDKVQPKTKPEQKIEDCNSSDASNFADVFNSPNKSTVMLTTFEMSHDSGCPTTFSDLDGTTASCVDIKEFFPAFKTANSKAISIPSEAIMRAKASLDEAAGAGINKTSNSTTPKHYHKIETVSTYTTKSPVKQSIFPNHASRMCVSDAPKTDSPKSFQINISSCSSPPSNESDYKTGSKVNNTVSDVDLQTETLFREKKGRGSGSSKCISQKLDFKRSSQRHAVFDINSTHKPTAVDSSHDDLEEIAALTASQKADVTELCSLLEEANSQHEFTQFKTTSLASDNHTTEREWDPDIINDIDFDDSFNCDVVKGKHPVKTEASSVGSSDLTQILDAHKLCITSKKTQNGIVPFSMAEGDSVVDGMKNTHSIFSDNTQFHCFGFKTAKGKAINISEKSLNKAMHFFDEDIEGAICNGEVKVDAGVINPEHFEIEPSVNISVSMGAQYKTYVQKKQDINFCSGDVNAAFRVMNEQVAGNASTEQDCLREKADVCVDSNSHFGFHTAGGVRLKVSEKTLLQARKLLDIDSFESEAQPTLHCSGKHVASISTAAKKTKAVSCSETPMKINQPDTVMVNQKYDDPDIDSFNSEKSSNDAKEDCAKIIPSKMFIPQSVQDYVFQTASGKGVSISASAIEKAKTIFKDCDSNPDSWESANMEAKNDKLDVEIVKQTTRKSVTFSDVEKVKTVIRDSKLIANVSVRSSLDQQPPQEEGWRQKGLQSEFSKYSSELLPLNSNCGFSTASGKKVSVSAGALQRAQEVLSESVDGFSCANSYQKTNQLVSIKKSASSSGKHKGSCTAGGKKQSVSAAELQKAKNLFRDFEEESLSSDYKHQNSFSDVSKKQSTEMGSAFRGCSEHEFGTGNSSGKNVGFSTAGGKKVPISSAALQKAKHLFENCEQESLASRSPQHQGCKGFTTASGKNVTVSEKALREVRAVFAGCEDTTLCHEPKNSSGNNVGFSTAGGKKVTISGTALQRAKCLFEDFEEERLVSGSPQHQSSEVFSTANGKNFTVSEKTLSEVWAPFVGCSDVSNHESETGISLGKNGGFSTAGGKKVPISATALQKAKHLFENCEQESLASRSPQHQGCKGFTTASGKNVTVSEKALSEVRAVFTGCEDTTFSHEPKNSSGNDAGFSTADGKKVDISATPLQKAKGLFKDCEETNLASKELVSEKIPSQTESSHQRSEDIANGNLMSEQLTKKNGGLSTVSGKVVSISKVALAKSSMLLGNCDTQMTNDNLLLCDTSKNCAQIKDRQFEAIPHPLPSKATQNEPAQLNLHSLDFNSCTDTQQKYFEQEAMACTKALLADDDINESARLMISDDSDYKSSSFHYLQTQESLDQNRKRKRQLDASNVADPGQPPLKRQLLSEFDKTLDARSSGLTPLKCCPSGTPRVFKYNVHLQPHVTGPNRHPMDQKSDDQQRCSAVSVSEGSSGFIPPFKKENKEKPEDRNQIDPHITSTPHGDNVTQYCGEKNLHENSNYKPNTSVESMHLKIMDIDEKDMKAWQDSLQLARDMQDMRLRKKKRQTIRPVPGTVYLAKTSGVSRIGLRDAVGHKCPGLYTREELYQHGVHHKVLEVTSENAESFRFDCNDFFKRELLVESGALQLADGGWLVPDSKGTVGKEEFYRALCDTPGADPKLISDAWVFNHYRWIVWKRASMERTFPDLMGNLCLTPEQVLLQLKFRYDVEVDHCRRSALRRIMERDDTPAKTLVLCVCGDAQTCQNPEKPMKDDKNPSAKMESCVIWLTDGWYSIKGLLDPPLSAMLNKGRLRIGDKIVTSGAELVGSQEPCPPLEAPESLMLKISANSTRRARWDTKLGYHCDPRPIRLQLSSLYSSGGVVSCVNIMVLRSYPTQWMEKKPNSIFIFRNDRAEDREARKHNNSKHKSMDLLISKLQTQFEKEMEGKKKSRGQRRTFSRHDIEALQDGEELYEAMERDPAVETHLSERQMEAVSKYRCCLEERRQAELQERVQKAVMEAQETEGGCPNRNVTPVWKLRITDASDLQSDCVYTLNIWHPPRDMYGLLKEGHRYRAYHLATSEGKKRSGIAHIQLTATKKTHFQDIKVSPEWLHQHFRARECVRFRELQNPHFTSPCGEVDIVGCVVSIVGKQGHCPIFHLVDENFDLVSVRTYCSLEQLAIEELVKPRALVALSNLQVRMLSGPMPSLYAGEQALFSVNPKESHLQEAMANLKTFVQTCEQFFSIAEEKVSDVVPSSVLGSFQSPRTPGVQSKPRMNDTVTPQQRSVFTPLKKRTPVSACNSEDKDPKSLKRRRGLDYLSRIPLPPPLTPLKTIASPCVNKTFNPPRRSMTPKRPQNESRQASCAPAGEEKWVHDEELAMIDTQALVDGLREKV